MDIFEIPDKVKEDYRYAIEQARNDRPRYFDWIKNEIGKVIDLINRFDKKYILGGLGSRLIKSTPTMFNQFAEMYGGVDKNELDDEEFVSKDEEVETLLEYTLSIATATPNNSTAIPSKEDIESIYQQLSKIKTNTNFWELSADPPLGGDEFDHWLRTSIMLETMNVRGDGYHTHIKEVFNEVFEPFNGFIEQYYGFTATEVYETIELLDSLVYSKVGNSFGATQSYERLTKWMEEIGEETVSNVMKETGKNFIRQFTEENPDLYDENAPDSVVSHHLDNIESYPKMFWVIPKSERQKLIFERLALTFGENDIFFQNPRFKGFPLNDTLVKNKPLIKEDGKYFHFSLTLGFRNIFKIVEELIKEADIIYYANSFKGNANINSRDNYIERKTKELFEKLLPSANFYHSLKYSVEDDGQLKHTELDILGISGDTGYIIEVKAGELNSKHRRGALKGLKDRLKETINEGSYQCHRALTYINDNDVPTFEYVEENKRKTLLIDKSAVKNFIKISVTFEHFSAIAANLRYLINTGILSPVFKWTWIVSLYDLMIFSDLIANEADFQEYLKHRITLYDREDIEFSDEIDILGYFFEGNFPLGEEEKDIFIRTTGFSEDIDNYYTKIGVGMPGIEKPKKK